MRLLIIILLFPLFSQGQFIIDSYRFGSAPASILPGDVSGNTLMFGLRVGKTGFSGNIIKVRRSSDNTTQDIGISGTDLDVAAFSAFVGGGNGYVETWYDQSGNGLHATQSTLANQPQVILNHKNGHPSLYFDGTDFLEIASSAASFNYLHQTAGSYSIVGQPGTVANPNVAYTYFGNNAGTTAKTGIIAQYDDRASQSRSDATIVTVTRSGASTFVVDQRVNAAILPNVYSLIQTSLDLTNATAHLRHQTYVNTVAIASNTFTASAVNVANATHNMQIGANGNSATFLTGYISEISFNNTIVSSGDRAAMAVNQNAYWAIY